MQMIDALDTAFVRLNIDQDCGVHLYAESSDSADHSETSFPEIGNIGGMPDSCYMWRRDGPLAGMRAARPAGGKKDR